MEGADEVQAWDCRGGLVGAGGGVVGGHVAIPGEHIVIGVFRVGFAGGGINVGEAGCGGGVCLVAPDSEDPCAGVLKFGVFDPGFTEFVSVEQLGSLPIIFREPHTLDEPAILISIWIVQFPIHVCEVVDVELSVEVIGKCIEFSTEFQCEFGWVERKWNLAKTLSIAPSAIVIRIEELGVPDVDDLVVEIFGHLIEDFIVNFVDSGQECVAVELVSRSTGRGE